MMFFKASLILLVSAWMVLGQRPTFAGTKPIGFPELTNKTDNLESRFGPGTPLVLPIEAKGDRDLVERISKLPVDQQPFWYINWKALEENRKNPQTYEPRGSPFAEQTGQAQNNNNAQQNNNPQSNNNGNRQARQFNNQRRRFNSF